jgi:hypothetical protein
MFSINKTKYLNLCYALLGASLSVFFVLFLLLKYFLFAYPLPWKIVHPKHPSFNINLFKISDYQENNQQLANALNCLFPVGTPKADVDKIMVGIAGAEVYPNIKSNKKLVGENEYLYMYSSAKIKFFHKYYPINNVYKILVIKYDKNNRLEFSPFVIYGRCVDGDINAK